MDTTLKTVLWSQFGATINMLENAIRACPDELWNDDSQPKPSMRFWYIAYHTLFWLDVYLSDSADGFAPPAPFTLSEFDPSGLLPDKVYTKDEILGYLNHDFQKCQVAIETLTDERSQRLWEFRWGKMSFLELLLYNMRHVQEHAAQ